MKNVTAKEAFDKFKPENCVFVISTDNQGNPNGMVAGWNMKCSVEPPLIAVALSKRGNTQRLIRQSGEFVLAVPNAELVKEVELFGSAHGNEVDKFKESGIKTTRAKLVKPPLIKDATINFECNLFKQVDAGDHILFIGHVLNSYVDKDKGVLFNMRKEKGYSRN